VLRTTAAPGLQQVLTSYEWVRMPGGPLRSSGNVNCTLEVQNL
jgi:hypothetical protein